MLRLIVALLIAPAIVFGACPNGAFEWQTKCYFFKSNGTGFPEAEADCASSGGHLTSIHDSFSNLLITERASDAFGAAKDFWIGLSNVASSKKLAWTDNSKNDFSSWDKNQPSNSSGIKCTSVGAKTGLWKTDNCFQQKPYVCATANTGGTTPTSGSPMPTTTIQGVTQTTTTPSSGNKCPGNMTYFAGTNACYGNYFNSEDGAKTWNDAESFCQTMGGHLASVHSDAEFGYIMSYDYVSNAFYWPWVGLSTADQGQTWTWTDGTPADYLPWDAGEPTQGFTCTFANSQGFETDDCGDNAGTLCKVQLS